MVLKFKKIYVNEKFKDNILNGIISHDLILDIFFSKKNSKIFRHTFFGVIIFYLLLVYLPIIFSILSISFSLVLKHLCPYIPIAFLLFYILSLITIVVYFRCIPISEIKGNESIDDINKFLLSIINIYYFYLDLRIHIDDRIFENVVSKRKALKSIAPKSTILKRSINNNDIDNYKIKDDELIKNLFYLNKTSNLVYTNENNINLKKREKWLGKKKFWSIASFYNNQNLLFCLMPVGFIFMLLFTTISTLINFVINW